jgi:hypothetical protein
MNRKLRFDLSSWNLSLHSSLTAIPDAEFACLHACFIIEFATANKIHTRASPLAKIYVHQVK